MGVAVGGNGVGLGGVFSHDALVRKTGKTMRMAIARRSTEDLYLIAGVDLLLDELAPPSVLVHFKD